MIDEKAANAAPRPAKEPQTIIACFSCNLYPGAKGWQGYFRKDGAQWLHVDCPKPKSKWVKAEDAKPILTGFIGQITGGGNAL